MLVTTLRSLSLSLAATAIEPVFVGDEVHRTSLRVVDAYLGRAVVALWLPVAKGKTTWLTGSLSAPGQPFVTMLGGTTS
jgi:hypothetical protein